MADDHLNGKLTLYRGFELEVAIDPNEPVPTARAQVREGTAVVCAISHAEVGLPDAQLLALAHRPAIEYVDRMVMSRRAVRANPLSGGEDAATSDGASDPRPGQDA